MLFNSAGRISSRNQARSRSHAPRNADSPEVDAAVDRVLSRLKGVDKTSNGWSAKCPAHDDQNPSLSVGIGDEGKILLRCHSAECPVEEITAAIGLKVSDLFVSSTRTMSRTPPSQTRGTTGRHKSLTVEALAEAKGFTPDYLRSLGVEQCNGHVEIPYHLGDGTLAPRHRKRTSTVGKKGSTWKGKTGDPIVPYGLYELAEARGDGYLVLVEGESDCWTLWHYGFPALGIPGATQAKTLTAEHVAGFRELCVFREPDEGGDRFIKGVTDRLRQLGFQGEVFELRLEGVKDPNDLHTRNPRGFKAAFTKAIKNATKIDIREWPALDYADDEEAPEFPVEVFPEKLKNFVQEAASSICCPPDFLGVPMLITAGAAIGNSRVLELKPRWTEGSRLYGGCVGEPGTAKSPAMRQVVSPVVERQKSLERTWRVEMEEHRRRLADWDSRPRAERGPKPVPPKMERVITSDITVEALAVILADNPQGVLLHRDELTGWSRSMNAYKGNRGPDRQFWLSCWSGETVVVDRKGSPDPVMVQTPFVSVLGGVCPDMLKELLEEKGRSDGSIERLLLSFPTSIPQRRWTEAGISPKASAAWASALDSLFALQMHATNNGKCPVAVKFSAKAKKAWSSWYDKQAKEEEDPSLLPSLKNFYAKTPAYCARLALIVHQLRVACGEASSKNIDDVSVRGAIRLVEYFKGHATRIHHRVAGRLGQLTEEARAVVVWLRQHNLNEFSAHKLWQHMRKRFDSQLEMTTVLQELKKLSLIRRARAPEQKRGRKPSPEYEVHPGLFGA